MAKFDLLTTLTLNAAGFDKGLNKVAASTQKFKRGAQDASKSISSSFSGMGNILGGAVNSQVGQLGQSIMGGVSAFRSMIPAINGVKVALISSGIGAAVVAIGTAFAQLSSYLTGTVEGSNKLNVIMGYLKGTFNVILQRVNLLGSALVKLFEGDFKGMAQDFQAAFKGGIFDEIKQDANQYSQFAKEANDLKMEKLALDREEVEVNERISELEKTARNAAEGTLEKKKALAEWNKLDNYFGAKKADFLKREYELQEKINKAKGANVGYDDLQAATDKYKAWKDYVTADNKDDIARNKVTAKVNNEVAKSVQTYTQELRQNVQALEAQRELLFSQGKDVSAVTDEIVRAKGALDEYNQTIQQFDQRSIGGFLKVPDLSIIEDEINESIQGLVIEPVEVELKPVDNYVTKLTDQLSSVQTISGLASQAVQGLGEAFISMAEGSEVSFKEMINSMLSGLRSVVYGLLAEALAKTIVNALNPKNPANQASFGLAGIAQAAAGITAVQALFNKLPKFASGGIVDGYSYAGDKVIARVNSGEMVLTQRQQARLFEMANGSGGVGGEVRFEIAGDKLIGVLNNYNRKIKSYR